MRTILSILAGVLGFVALFPFSGDDSDPPTHYSVLGYEVPTDEIWLALSVGVAVGLAAWFLLSHRSSS